MMEQLVERLQKARLQLLARGSRGLAVPLPGRHCSSRRRSSVWPIEARLLFDLQNVCIDRERAIYAAEVVEWVVSLGKKPIKRLLPYQGDVLTVEAPARVALGRARWPPHC